MNESFLHYLWQFQQFDQKNLFTTQTEPLSILKVGYLNSHAGADFQEARILIGTVEWAGSVEIHIKSSDWLRHTHERDTAYESVILHVVWEHDQEILRKDGTPIPTLLLNNRTEISLLAQYEKLMKAQEVIPCAKQFGAVDEFHKLSMLDKMLMQRLQEKADLVQESLIQNQQDWEETAYQLLAKNLGFKLNAEPFLMLAQRLPLKIIQKHRNNLLQIEALLFGVAGFLTDEPTDDYQAVLKKEFQFLSSKYDLKNQVLAKHQWKFLRLRPANFATVRLAQFASFLQENGNLFSIMLNLESIKSFHSLFRNKPSAYWTKHFVFGKPSEGNVPAMGATATQNILINTIVPLLVAYSQQKDDRQYLEKAIQLLESLPAEDNVITKMWKSLGLPLKSAFDSQASIEWYNHFCQKKRCLACNVGVKIVGESR